MSKKISIALLCGGQSAEHEISLMSAKNIVSALDKNKYDVQVIGIDKSGTWHKLNTDNFLINEDDPTKIHFSKDNNQIFYSPNYYSRQTINCGEYNENPEFSLVIPVLHGPNGEDGTIQGMFKLAGIPVLGCGALSSAMCMDKDITKKILNNEGIPVCKHLLARKKSTTNPSFETCKNKLGTPLFIKPANMGSSVGVTKVTNESEYTKALEVAFKYDDKILIEEAVDGRELEIAVLGNLEPKVSIVGEVAPTLEFYDFEAKYVNPDGAHLIIPADIPQEVATKMSELAKNAFKALECKGLARCDFFYTKDGKLLINELNTFPGFTNISQYPMLWEKSGLNNTQLMDELISLSLDN